MSRVPPTFKPHRCDLCGDVATWRLAAPCFLLPEGDDEVAATLVVTYRLCERCTGRARHAGAPDALFQEATPTLGGI